MVFLRNSKTLRAATPPSFVHPDQQLIEVWKKMQRERDVRVTAKEQMLINFINLICKKKTERGLFLTKTIYNLQSDFTLKK